MSHSDSTGEALSALIDGEASELELARLLKSVDDPEVRASWVRSHRLQSALHTQAEAVPRFDISGRVREAIEQPARQSAHPMFGLAVAASVTFAVVFGGQQWLTDQSVSPVGSFPGGVVSMQGASAQRASFGGPRDESSVTRAVPSQRVVRAPVTTSSAAYEQLTRERYERLVTEHAQATATLQPNLLLPHARVPAVQP